MAVHKIDFIDVFRIVQKVVESIGDIAFVDAARAMGEALRMASESEAYTLTDRATFAAYRKKTHLVILVENDRRLFNPYGILAVNPKRHPGVNIAGAKALMDWITSKEGRMQISRFKGLGEMDAAELWDTTMNPANRMLIRVEVEDAARADQIFSMLMGDQVEPRREFIEKNAKYVRNLDV